MTRQQQWFPLRSSLRLGTYPLEQPGQTFRFIDGRLVVETETDVKS